MTSSVEVTESANSTRTPEQVRFTPGPWRAVAGDVHYHGDSEEDNGGGFTIMMSNYSARGGRVVHSLHYADGVFPHDAKDYDEAEANARLIAAAPDLYAALEGMVAAFKPFTMKPMGGPGSAARFEQEAQIEAAAKARAALSKASGTAVNHPNSGSSELPVKVPNHNGETA